MVFHFDAAIQIMEEILTHELVNPEELYEILEYKEKDSNSVQEERLWKMFKGYLIRANRLSADVIPFSPDLRAPALETHHGKRRAVGYPALADRRASDSRRSSQRRPRPTDPTPTRAFRPPRRV